MNTKKLIRHVFVYLGAAVLIGGLGVGTKFYVDQSKQRQEQAQEETTAKMQAEAEARLTKVKVVEVMPLPFTDVLILPGSVTAREDVDLASKLSGVIEWIGPKEGQRVKKGDKLLQVEVKSVETQVQEARAVYEQAKKDYERAKTLHAQSIVSKNELDSAQTQLETSKAALDSASVSLGDGTLYSPLSGILDNLDVDRGEYISPGQTIMKIVDIDQVYIELPVPEKDILYFTKGQHVDLEMSVANVAQCKNPKEVDGQTQCWFTGTIDFISMTADSSTRTYLMKVLVNNPDRLLRPGMIVRAHLVRRELKDAIAVPFFTIIDREAGKAVFVVENGVAVARPIKYGTFSKGLVEIRHGLNIGDKLVIVGQRGLVDQQKVEVSQDLTPLAKEWVQQGKDLAELSVEILNELK